MSNIWKRPPPLLESSGTLPTASTGSPAPLTATDGGGGDDTTVECLAPLPRRVADVFFLLLALWAAVSKTLKGLAAATEEDVAPRVVFKLVPPLPMTTFWGNTLSPSTAGIRAVSILALSCRCARLTSSSTRGSGEQRDCFLKTPVPFLMSDGCVTTDNSKQG